MYSHFSSDDRSNKTIKLLFPLQIHFLQDCGQGPMFFFELKKKIEVVKFAS